MYTMNFEYDPNKSRSTNRKHGINFEQAIELWKDPDFIETPAKTEDETRHLVIGKLTEKYWSAIITYRGEAIRIISVRRSRDEEIAAYES